MNLVIDSGLQSYRVNDKAEVFFNPTDPAFAQRLYDAFIKIDNLQERLKKDTEKLSGAEMFEAFQRFNLDARQEIDILFGDVVCEQIFGNMSLCALAGGLPVWVNLLFAIMDEVEGGFIREKKLTDAKIKKYTQKYSKK